MRKTQTRFIIIIVLTLLTAGFTARISYEPPLENKKFFDFPMNVGEWKGEDVEMSDYVYQGIETEYLFLRNYRSEKYQQPVNLSIVWFDEKNIAFHAPEACLGGVGITVQEKTTTKIKINNKDYDIGKLVVDFNGRKELVLYYFDVEGKLTTSQSLIRLYVLAKRLMFKRSSASFVRLMTSIETNESDAFNELQDFLNTVFPVASQYTYTDMITK
jgi:EpsI family protein